MSSKVSKVLLLFLFLYYCTNHTATALSCFPADAAALLKLKRSFLDPNLTSWRRGTDCCRWEAVACDAASGRVAALDLGGRGLRAWGIDPVLFNLTALRNLSMADADFMGGRLPSFGFELLTEMVHLDFSFNTNLFGQLPIGIARLRKLVTLDFSNFNDYPYPILFLEEPSFETLIANLSSLIELHLDGVDISSNGGACSSRSTALCGYCSMLACGIGVFGHMLF
ncbi:hypothetical protein PR202_gb26351 [Eleusine coracana subsp. coracana]|uniref:Leucine-rich repeat-containing N-terminal plant-type domain-containing protein n=1 Tax=Eleusine coracana subsp. coracana TaxID=191504 RepID=A0AAV5FRM7_ELECO|nr:hypothetical protein PR202_gb26351 [Eleusine coracana subsp. coracana]